MSEPIVFVSTHRIKEGKLDGFKQLSREMTPLIEAGKPNTVFFQPYLNEEGTEVTIVHVFPDADAMDLHFQGADERSEKAYEFIQPQHFEIYGTPSDQVLAMMRQAATGPEIDLIVKPQHLGGFIRLTSG
jgi:quinol monooxygenase YgiN